MLLAYGAMCWGFAIVFLDLIFVELLQYSSNEFGVVGISLTCLLALVLLKRVFKGFFHSEFMTMVTERKGRTAKWIGGIAAIVLGAFVVPVKHYATGQFEVRPGERHQVASPVAGYVRTVYVSDGETVPAGAAPAVGIVRSAEPDCRQTVRVDGVGGPVDQIAGRHAA